MQEITKAERLWGEFLKVRIVTMRFSWVFTEKNFNKKRQSRPSNFQWEINLNKSVEVGKHQVLMGELA